jgi:hypothetical protein
LPGHSTDLGGVVHLGGDAGQPERGQSLERERAVRHGQTSLDRSEPPAHFRQPGRIRRDLLRQLRLAKPEHAAEFLDRHDFVQH